VEEFLLRALLATYKLDIINKQHIGNPVFVAKVVGRMVSNSIYQIVGKLLSGYENCPLSVFTY